MSERSASWRPGQTVCRCCLAEGCYKDISTEYFWMGKREVYADMLLDTFDVNISFSQAGGPGSSSRLICEPCISRLRDASEFKRQVLECEKAFVQQLEPGSSTIDVDDGAITLTGSEIKVEAIKLEKSLSDDEDFHDAPNFDDDDDDLDDQPLTTYASRVPKKESVDILELLDTEKTAEKRKMPVRSKATSAKKLKAAPKTVVAKAATSKTATKTGKVDTKKKDEAARHSLRWNAEIISRFTTAYPFRLPGAQMVCVYCDDEFSDPALYRDHIDSTHGSKPNVRKALSYVNSDNYLKVDATFLKCRICDAKFERLQEVADHLVKVHHAKLKLDDGLLVLPYKFVDDKLLCGICDRSVATLRHLGRHLATHFLKYSCDYCGKLYMSMNTLKRHALTCRNKDQSLCFKCKEYFPSLKARNEHYANSRGCWFYVCKICSERFPSYRIKNRHMIEVHDEQHKAYKCPQCDEVFEQNIQYVTHFKQIHDTENDLRCEYCSKVFSYKKALKEHLVTHTKEKNFTCNVCDKAFGTDKSLRQHLWTHSDVKRFSCDICHREFNQKVCLRGHMKTHHPEVRT